MTIGDGGNHEGLYDHWSSPAPDWVSFRSGAHFGRGDLLVVNKTHLRWQWWPNSADASEDEVWILNTFGRPADDDDLVSPPTNDDAAATGRKNSGNGAVLSPALGGVLFAGSLFVLFQLLRPVVRKFALKMNQTKLSAGGRSESDRGILLSTTRSPVATHDPSSEADWGLIGGTDKSGAVDELGAI